MVKFGKPEATWKTREEENSCGRVWEWGRDSSGGKGTRKGEGGNERSSTRGPRMDGILGRKNRSEIRDKETNIDNEKTSMAKKETERRSGRRR